MELQKGCHDSEVDGKDVAWGVSVSIHASPCLRVGLGARLVNALLIPSRLEVVPNQEKAALTRAAS